MTIIFYSLNEGDPWYQGERDLSVKQIVRRLNKAYEGYKKDSCGASFANHCDVLLGIFHALRLPDGRIWDTCNGWRQNMKTTKRINQRRFPRAFFSRTRKGVNQWKY